MRKVQQGKGDCPLFQSLFIYLIFFKLFFSVSFFQNSAECSAIAKIFTSVSLFFCFFFRSWQEGSPLSNVQPSPKCEALSACFRRTRPVLISTCFSRYVCVVCMYVRVYAFVRDVCVCVCVCVCALHAHISMDKHSHTRTERERERERERKK